VYRINTYTTAPAPLPGPSGADNDVDDSTRAALPWADKELVRQASRAAVVALASPSAAEVWLERMERSKTGSAQVTAEEPQPHKLDAATAEAVTGRQFLVPGIDQYSTVAMFNNFLFATFYSDCSLSPRHALDQPLPLQSWLREYRRGAYSHQQSQD
jgi:hypothetical protein